MPCENLIEDRSYAFALRIVEAYKMKYDKHGS